jgi:hypothetical protein
LELQFLADGILFENIKIQCKNQPGYKYREENEYIVDGKLYTVLALSNQGSLMNLEGVTHRFNFTHEYSIIGQEVDMKTTPTVSIGSHSLEIIDWEAEIEIFIANVKVCVLVY